MRLGVSSVFSDDIAIDLGTANTLVHVAGTGVIIDEPSLVAVRNQHGMREILAVGDKAKQMLGHAAQGIEAIRPMRDGVIADFVATEEMLRQFIKRTKSALGFRRPRILICVPAGATLVERRVIYETAISAGARRAFLIEEPIAAAIGAGLPVDEPAGSMVVDIGGGTTDIAVLSLGRVVQARSLRCAGNAMDQAIIRYIRRNHNLLIGESNAERIKIEAGTASTNASGRVAEIHIRGRDLREGKHTSIVLEPADIAKALDDPIDEIVQFVQRSLEDLPPEISAHVCDRGIKLTGGGSMLDKLDYELERRVGVKFAMSEHPLQCVIRGSAAVINELSSKEHLLVHP